jgi:4-carboxymuconolactone decarboxylase
VTAGPSGDRAEAVRDRYRLTFGSVPAGIEQRLAVAAATGRLDSLDTIEELRRVLLHDNPLGSRVQQLVHFAQLVCLGRAEPARLHARGALRAGATTSDLVGVAETSLVTAGMPAYSLAVSIIAELVEQDPGDADGQRSDRDPAGRRAPPAGSTAASSVDTPPVGLAFLLGVAHRARRRAWEASLSDLELTAPQAAALRMVAAHRGVGVRQLARELVTDTMNARRLVTFLVDAGLCEARPDPHDARRRPLHTTPAGRELAAVVVRRAGGHEDDLTHVLGPDAHAALVAGLQRLADHDRAVPAPHPTPATNEEEPR